MFHTENTASRVQTKNRYYRYIRYLLLETHEYYDRQRVLKFSEFVVCMMLELEGSADWQVSDATVKIVNICKNISPFRNFS